MEAVGGSAEALPLPPPAGERDADGWMLDSWRWLQDGMGTDGGLGGLHDPNRLGSSPWQRLTERGLQWRVEGCPQEVCAAVFSCKAGVRRAHGDAYFGLDFELGSDLSLAELVLEGLASTEGE